MRHGTNIKTNQRLSPTFRENGNTSLRSRRLEVVGARKNRRARGRYLPLPSRVSLARPFFLAFTTSKRLLSRLREHDWRFTDVSFPDFFSGGGVCTQANSTTTIAQRTSHRQRRQITPTPRICQIRVGLGKGLNMASKGNSVFSRIIRRELPATFLHEDDQVNQERCVSRTVILHRLHSHL